MGELSTARTFRNSFSVLSMLSGCALVLLAVLSCQSVNDSSRGELESKQSELTSAEQLLARSIRFHDPDGTWSQGQLSLRWTSAGPDGVVALDFEIDYHPRGSFAMKGEYGGAEIHYLVAEGVSTAVVNGETELSDEVLASAALSGEDGMFWRNYFGFLGGMPMCLDDPIVQLEADAFEAEFEGRSVPAIRTSFSPDVGTDVWTFYFEPETAQLIGCRFDRADPARDGETLVFEELVTVAGVRLPKRRTWHMNADHEMIGIDELFARED